MILSEAAEALLLRLYGGRIPADAYISHSQAMYEILMQRDYIIGVESKNLVGDDGEIDNDLYVTYGSSESTALIISYDDFLKIYYTILPLKALALKDKRGTFIGISRIYPPHNPGGALLMVENGMDALVPDVASHAEGNLTWELTYINEGKRVNFPNMTPGRVPPFLAVDMIPQVQSEIFDTVNGADTISIPSRFATLMIDRAYQALAPIRGQADLVTDKDDIPTAK